MTTFLFRSSLAPMVRAMATVSAMAMAVLIGAATSATAQGIAKTDAFALIHLPTVATSAVERAEMASTAAVVPPQASTSFRPSKRPIGFRAYGVVDSNALAARQTFNAVIDTSRVAAVGVGGEIFRQGAGVFYRGAVSSMQADGHRAIAANDQVIPLDIALTVRMRVVEAGGGWRFARRSSDRLVPYLGGAVLAVRYEESSALAGDEAQSPRWFPGVAGIGGVDYRVAGWLFAGAEAQFRRVPGALGDGGVSKVFDERDLGGFTLRLLVGIRK
ncbi:MAG: hypothetical protein ABI652_03760 [Acidobacteriota bacterium]